MKILLTGFDAFGDLGENPSENLVRRLSELPLDAGNELISYILPTEFSMAGRQIQELINLHQPDFLILTGVNQKVRQPQMEQLAINWRQAREPDNCGFRPMGEEIDPGDEPVYRSSVNIHSLKEHLYDRGFDIEISNYAGSFVCNSTYFHALSTLSKTAYESQCVFIHIPMPSDWEGAQESEYTFEYLGDFMRAVINYIQLRQRPLMA